MNRPWIVAHRGVAIGAGENTLGSFAKAIDVGADMIEFDVRLTGDGELIAFHDSQIHGIDLVKLTRNQIADQTGTHPALFTEILELCSGKIKLDIELKEDGYIDRVVKILNDSIDLGQVIVTSFIPAALERTKALLPGVKTGLLVGVGSPKPYVRTRSGALPYRHRQKDRCGLYCTALEIGSPRRLAASIGGGHAMLGMDR